MRVCRKLHPEKAIIVWMSNVYTGVHIKRSPFTHWVPVHIPSPTDVVLLLIDSKIKVQDFLLEADG